MFTLFYLLFLISDIHGNLTDLLTYDMNVWRSNVYFFSSNLLFLGDYVDRGPNSVECILYLLCMKAIAPHRVHLLRGNHETRQLQREYTFHNEVTEKFGVEGGFAETIFDAFNAVFDVMPLVAIVDESIYCAHGGIPSQATLSQIAAIPSPLEAIADPSVANEILWNDPITDKEHADLMNNDATVANNTAEHPDGFPSNTRRGTACYFSEYALRRFLAANALSHVIRAHECIPVSGNSLFCQFISFVFVIILSKATGSTAAATASPSSAAPTTPTASMTPPLRSSSTRRYWSSRWTPSPISTTSSNWWSVPQCARLARSKSLFFISFYYYCLLI